MGEATSKAREILGEEPPPPDAEVKRVLSRGIELHRASWGNRNQYRRLPKLLGPAFIFASVPSGVEELERALEIEFSRAATMPAATAPH